MFNKKLLFTVGLLVAAFVVINVGMFFFLKATQPKSGTRALTAAHAAADSLKHGDTASADSTKHDSAQVAVAHDSVKTDSVAVTEVAAIPTESQPAVSSPEVTSVTPAESPASEPVVENEEPQQDTTAATAEEDPQTVAEAAKQGDLREMAKLAKLLESMKPEAAADIVSHLDTDQIVTLVMKMKDRSAGRMLAALPIEQAARVAERMSQTATRSRGGS